MKRIDYNQFLFLILISVFFISPGCGKNNPQKEAEQIVAEWIGKTIIFPDSLPCLEMNKTVSCSDYKEYPYKILLYADSTGCTTCKLHLKEWVQLMEEAETILPGQVAFLFYFQPKSKENLISSLRGNRFKHPVYLDMQNEIYWLNKFPSNKKYQCFLINQNNEVVLIGNPMLNPIIWNLYKQHITGEMQNEKEEIITTARVDHLALNFGEAMLGEEKEIKIFITNTGNQPFIIQRVITSCGCTDAIWEKHPVNPGGKTSLDIKITPEETGLFQKNISIYCNIPEKVLKLPIKGIIN